MAHCSCLFLCADNVLVDDIMRFGFDFLISAADVDVSVVIQSHSAVYERIVEMRAGYSNFRNLKLGYEDLRQAARLVKKINASILARYKTNQRSVKYFVTRT